jgi:hypothetical protein
MDASPELSVYSEAKSEYTRQLCVFLIPSLETYFLNLLDTAKEQSPTPQKALWQFQNLLQAIPDWNQDKVIRETDIIQTDSKCDYLEELLTAVFLAHTKVLSAIRLNTNQNKMQITIPKLDHFLHRVLSESARSLWTNAFLFAETSSIEKQKNLRQVASLLQEAIIQAIRGMLPVKKILRQYLQVDEEEETKPVEKQLQEAEESKPVEEETKPVEEESKPVEEEVKVEEESKPVEEKIELEEETKLVEEEMKVEEEETKPVKCEGEEQDEKPVLEVQTEEEKKPEQPTIYIDTKPSVTFQQTHTFFSSDNLESNQHQDTPFAEAELRPPEEEEDDEWDNEFEQLEITDEELPMDAEELNL